MTFASVVLDIPTRALDAAFDYAVPAALEAEAAAEASSCSGSLVGCTVLVPFSHRHVVGYVVALSSEPPAGVDPSKILEVERILASSAFDEASAEVARWIARELGLSDGGRLLIRATRQRQQAARRPLRPLRRPHARGGALGHPPRQRRNRHRPRAQGRRLR